MSPFSINGGDSLSLVVMVVEYLESSMSKDLLCKFPDNSAFDFDYAQSSIWSPLLPRPAPPSNSGGLELSRRLSYGETGGDDQVGLLLENTKKMAVRIKRKFSDNSTVTVLGNIMRRCGKMKKRRKTKSFGLSPAGSGSGRWLSSSSSPSPKAWAKVMKAAVKQFKKRKNKDDYQNVHLILSPTT